MISHRSESFSRGLVLAALITLGGSSCLSSHEGSQHSLAVKVDSRPSQSASFEPEYFEGEAAPETPVAPDEQRPAAPSSAHVWIAGQHTRQNGEWVWVSGHYAVPPSSDVVWVPGHWVSHLHGYAWISGAWR